MRCGDGYCDICCNDSVGGVWNLLGRRADTMILKYPKKGESIYDLNPVLRNHKDFVAIGEIKMRFVALFADKVDSPFRHKTGDSLSSAVAKTISEMWDGNLIKDEYIATVDLRDKGVVNAIKLYDELFNPEFTRKIVRRIENLHLLQDRQDEFLKHGETVKIDADNAIKYQAECSKMLKDNILRKLTEEIMYYNKLLSEQNVLPIEVLTRLEGNKQQEDKESKVVETADDVNVDELE